MSYDVIFLLEEPSIQTVLEAILPKLISESITYKCIPHRGKQDLTNAIPRTIKAFRFSPSTKLVIVHDQDSHDCKKLKAELSQICQNAGGSKVLIRIVCHELESWFLGNLAAVEEAYHLKPNSLSKLQGKSKFRNPDRLNSAKQEIRRLVPEYYENTHSKKIAPYLSLTENTSHSFQIFCSGVQKFI